MREIKFRAWSEKQKMYIGEWGVFPAVDQSHQSGPPSGASGAFIHEQFTGLRDRNGKEIYEGDILGGIYSCAVGWCDACNGWNLIQPGYGCLQCEGDVSWLGVAQDQGSREVIGNIHENPELLE